jgi:hypothetical protein
MSLPAVEQRISRHEAQLNRIQEVLLFRRPFVLALVVVGIAAFSGVVYSYECGFFATVSLIALVYYGVLIVWTYLGPRIDAWLFPPLPSLDNPAGSNRVGDVRELCDGLKAVYGILSRSLNSSIRNLAFGAASLVWAAILWTVSAFWLNLILTGLVLFLPGLLLLPPIQGFWHPFLQRLARRSEKEKKD